MVPHTANPPDFSSRHLPPPERPEWGGRGREGGEGDKAQGGHSRGSLRTPPGAFSPDHLAVLCFSAMASINSTIKLPQTIQVIDGHDVEVSGNVEVQTDVTVGQQLP